ncbi:hypothetical protein EC553_03785 [Helicobacter pylori]|nr:hypothetical protein EC553_03785 [Helicobacter pylori]
MGFYKLIATKLCFHWRSAQTLKTIGIPGVGGEFGSCSVSLRDFTESELQRIPYSFHASYLIKA